MDVEVKLDCRV